MIRRPTKGPLADPLQNLDSIKGDTFELKPKTHESRPTILSAIKSFFKRLKNQYNRYPKRLFFDGGKEINSDLENWLTAKGIDFVTSSPYVHEQNGLIKQSVRVLIKRLRVIIISV